jgi:hypothetical protein
MQPAAIGPAHFPLGFAAPVLFLFLFAGGWCLACFKISRLGWNDWAQIYRCNRPLTGKLYSGRSGRFSFQGSYSRILNVRLCAEGIGLSVMLPWRVGHPPLLVPWSKVIGVEERSFFFFRSLRITISDLGKTFRFGLPLSAKTEFETRTLGFRGPLYRHPSPPPLK